MATRTEKEIEAEGSAFKAKLWPQIVATLAATLSAFGMGTVEAWTSPALPSLEKEQPFGVISHAQNGQIASFALLAALASGPVIGILVNKIGRKSVLILLGLIFVTGYALMAAAMNLNMLIVGRILTGFCAGGTSLVAPIYVGEISEKGYRGLFGSCFQLMATLGIFFTYVCGAFVNWAWLAVCCSVCPLIGLLLLLFVPATPRYLLSKKKREEALSALMWLRGAQFPYQVDEEFRSIEANLSMYAHKKSSIRDVFKLRTLKPMSICLSLLLFQQLSGIEAIQMYTVHIFSLSGIQVNPNYCAIAVGFLQVIATLSSAAIVDRAGRRRLLLISELGAALATFSLSGYFYLKMTDSPALEGFSWMPLVSLGAYIVSFAIGLGPVPFLLIAELNSPKMVGLASAVGTISNWGFGYVATATMVALEGSLGVHWTFGIFAGISFVGLVFVWFLVPETKGRSMEEIQKYWKKEKKVVQVEVGDAA